MVRELDGFYQRGAAPAGRYLDERIFDKLYFHPRIS